MLGVLVATGSDVGGSGSLEDAAVTHHMPASCWPYPNDPWRLGIDGTIRPWPCVGTGDSWGTFIDGDTVSLALASSGPPRVRGGWASGCTDALTPATKALLSPRGGAPLPTPPVVVGRTSGTP